LYDRALIIVTADHGELFEKKGFYGHKKAPMYEELLRVPLIVKLPYSERTGRIADRKIQLHDLFATILSACGMPVPDGTSACAFGLSNDPAVAAYRDVTMGIHRVLYAEGYKYFSYQYARPCKLIDPAQDQLEDRDLSGQFPDIAQKLRSELEHFVATHPPRIEATDTEISPEVIRGLKALGYIQ